MKTRKANRHKDNTPIQNCFNCDNVVPIGEGDHICYDYADGDPHAVIVIREYVPTSDFIKCGGKRWKEW